MGRGFLTSGMKDHPLNGGGMLGPAKTYILIRGTQYDTIGQLERPRKGNEGL